MVDKVLLERAKKFGFSNMFYNCDTVPEEQDWMEHMLTGVPQQSKVHVLTMVQSAVNIMAIQMAEQEAEYDL